MRQAFWITFGKYLKPVPSAGDLPVNWVNYKTGIKNIYFKTDVNQHATSIGILLTHKDDVIRQIYFEQFEAFKILLHEALDEEWDWQPNSNQFDTPAAWIGKIKTGVSVFDREKWP